MQSCPLQRSIDHKILDAVATTETRVAMCQEQKRLRATRSLQMTWKRDCYDGIVLDDWILLETVVCVFHSRVFFEMCSQCAKPVLRQEKFGDMSKQCCFFASTPLIPVSGGNVWPALTSRGHPCGMSSHQQTEHSLCVIVVIASET